VTILAVPPVIPAIERDLHLSQSATGALTGMPTFFLAVAAVPGALLIGRVGARWVLLGGMVAVAVASALRGGGPAVALLYAMSVAMGLGVAVSQLALPSLVAEWVPARIALGTSLYANGLIVGETVPAAVDPWLLPALGRSWELSLAVWAVPVLLQVALVLVLTREGGRPAKPETVVTHVPDFRSPQVLLMGATFGLLSAAYWGANTFIPGLVLSHGEPGLKDPALTSLNAAQILASALLVVGSKQMLGKRWPLALAGALVAVSSAAMLVSGGPSTVFWAGCIGFGAAFGLVLALALPALLAPPSRVHTFAAGIFTVGYLVAFVGPVVGGAAADLTHTVGAPFVVLGIAGMLAIFLAAATPMRPVEPDPG
jgi:MFS transporter, CP family, cyanate transporter